MTNPTDGRPGGLAWPDRDAGPEPAVHEPSKADTRTVRKPVAMWDRVKFLLLIGGLFWFFVWAAMSDNPLLPYNDAVNDTVRAKWWLLALGGLELLRQLHYLLSEHSPGWHHLWSERIFGGADRGLSRLNDWNRYRLARAVKVLVAATVFVLVLSSLFDLTPFETIVELPGRLWDYLPFFLQIFITMFILIAQFGALFWFLSRGGVDVYMPEDIKTRFSDVWGQDAVLDKVRENIVYLEDPESIESKGGYVPGGILLWGPPGTGKTLIAEAVAGETGRPFVFVDPGAFIQMFMGVGILKVKGLYRKLRKLALRYGGVIVFFDEADSLGNRGQLAGGFQGVSHPAWEEPGCNGLGYLSTPARVEVFTAETRGLLAPTRPGVDPVIMAGMGGGGGMGTLQALLTEMSGLKKPRGFLNRRIRRLLGFKPKPPPKYRILHMMATNRPDALDEAMLRPGRIDRIYKVGYPSKEGRKRTYQGYLDKVRHQLTDEQVDKLAVMSPYASGATMKDTVNEALVMAVRDGRDVIAWTDIIRAKQLKEHGVPDDAEYVERERHATAVHEACHAVAAFRLRRHATIDLATIERRGDIGGFVSSIPEEDLMFQWKSEYEVDIMTSISSLVGERMFFGGENSAGVGSDLRNATTVALRMHATMGMGDTITSHSVSLARLQGAQPAETGEDRNLLETELGRRVEAHLAELYQRTQRLLADNRREILAIAHALETHKTMSGEDVEAIIVGTVGPFVDGRVYHTPEFVRQVEAYHERAVAAHQQHLRDDLNLPALTPFPPDPEPVGAWNAEPRQER
jgi:cell division protease FtsH